MSNFGFLAKTALKDSRKNRGKLFMFMSSIILGIAALVAINSFNYNLVEDIDEQALSLMGADLVVNSNRKIPEEILDTLGSLPAEVASEIELFSMAYLPRIDQTQFMRVKAIEGNFPFYGKLKTEPAESHDIIKNGRYALVDEGMMLQYDLVVGDEIRIGNAFFEIGARLKNTFGAAGITSAFAPAVYISKEHIPATDLVQPGSLLDYSFFYKLPKDFPIDQWKADRRRTFRNENVRVETLEDQKEDLDEAFSGLNYFLNLVALVSLLLGCIGVASSVFIYVKTKIPSIAVFRCLGMSGMQAFTIYFLQIVALGLIGVIIGSALGTGIQVLIPKILSDLLPFEVQMGVSWKAIFEGVFIGLIITILFALLPLVSIRNISPLRTLRASTDGEQKRDPLVYLVGVLILVSIFLFLWRLTSESLTGLMFTGGLSIAFLLLFLVAKFIMWSVKRFLPKQWNFVFRQGLSNLFRPNNQTQTLLVSIGLGTAVLTTLFIIQGLILENVSGMDAGNQPNIVLYGIESKQNDEVIKITKEHDMPILQNVPIVTMKVEGWKGKSKKQWQADTTQNRRFWAANREARVSYRDTLDKSELLIRGEMPGPPSTTNDSIYISVDEGWARGLQVDLGDEIVWNVQGTRMKTYIAGIRKIEFKSMQTRFFVVFPSGVLEEAPQFQVMVTKSPDNETTAQFRSAIGRTFSNVSVIDLQSILVALNDILDKVSYIIKFMAAFSILTGLIVLISSLLLSKFQRIKEAVLLRTIGASRSQILKINATEYALLGGLSAATGILLALAGGYLLARFQLELDFNIQWIPILFVFLFVVFLTVIIGMFNTREVVSKSPLEVLRKEVG